MKAQYQLINYQTKVLESAVEALQVNSSFPLNKIAFALKAPTGAGKTIMMTSVLEEIMGSDPNAIIIWLSDSPDLNQQSLEKIVKAAEANKVSPSKCHIVHKDSFSGFKEGSLYMINYGKLTKASTLSRPHERMSNVTMWDHMNDLKNKNVTVFIDEAHKGTKLKGAGKDDKVVNDKERYTIIHKVLEHIEPKRLFGASATPDKFLSFLSKLGYVTRDYVVPPQDVIHSGIIKGTLVIKSTLAGDLTPFKSIYKSFIEDYMDVREAWKKAGEKREPLVLIQVGDGFETNEEEKSNLYNTLSESGLFDHNDIRHVFSGLGEVKFNENSEDQEVLIKSVSHKDIDNDNSIKVVLFKEALGEGWDCPRAEFLLSVRSKKSEGSITQTVGRVLRNPFFTQRSLIDEHPELDRCFIYTTSYDQNILSKIQSEFEGEIYEDKIIKKEDSIEVTLIDKVKQFFEENKFKTRVNNSVKEGDISEVLAKIAKKSLEKEPEKSEGYLLDEIDDIYSEQMVAALNAVLIEFEDELAAKIKDRALRDIAQVKGSLDKTLETSKETVKISQELNANHIDRMFSNLLRAKAASKDYISSLLENTVDAFNGHIDTRIKKRLSDTLAEVGEDLVDVTECNVSNEHLSKLIIVVVLSDLKSNIFDDALKSTKEIYGKRGVYIEDVEKVVYKDFMPNEVDYYLPQNFDVFYEYDAPIRGKVNFKGSIIAYQNDEGELRQTMRIDSRYEYEYLQYLTRTMKDFVVVRNPARAGQDALRIDYQHDGKTESFYPDFIVIEGLWSDCPVLSLHETKAVSDLHFASKYEEMHNWLSNYKDKGIKGYFITKIGDHMYRSETSKDVSVIDSYMKKQNWTSGKIGKKLIV